MKLCNTNHETRRTVHHCMLVHGHQGPNHVCSCGHRWPNETSNQ